MCLRTRHSPGQLTRLRLTNVCRQNQKGFSLIELLVIIGLMGILMTLASLSMDFVRKERLTSAAKQLVADIQKARVDAMVSSQSSNVMTGAGIRFNSGPSNTYFAFNFIDGDDNFAYSGPGEETGGARSYEIHSALSLEIAPPGETEYSDPSYNILMYNRMGLPSRFKSAGSDASDGKIVLLLRENTLNITKCVRVDINRIREGFWDANGTRCMEQ